MTCVILCCRHNAVMDSELEASMREVAKRLVVPCLDFTCAAKWSKQLATPGCIGGEGRI